MTIIASYPNNNQAQLAYNQLIETGMDKDQISVATLESKTPIEGVSTNHNLDAAAEVTGGTATGAVAGAAIGFLIGALALTIPGLGALLISGPLAVAIGGGLAAEATLGAAIGGVGGFVSGLIKSGASHDDAKLIEKNLQNGEVIIAVKDDIEGSHKRLLQNTNPTSLIVFAD